MAINSKSFTPHVIFPRRLSRGLDRFTIWWARHQRWWWIGIVIFMAVWTAYDVGQMVARASVLAGSRDIRGIMSMPDLRTRVTSAHAGRLIIVSPNEARYIDVTGAAWDIPTFGREASQDDMNLMSKNHIAVDGAFQVSVRPIKTTPQDLILATASDMLIKLMFIVGYGFIAYFLLRMGRTKSRFTKIGALTVLPNVNEVAGYESVKKELLEVVEYLRDPSRFEEVGARPPRGILLYGPPGNGKTMMAKALAGEANASFFEQSASSFMELYVGEGARAVRALFAEARRCAPSVVFIDEIDSIGGHRAAASHDERVQTLDAILTEIQGFSSGTGAGVVVVAATNRLSVLDEALIRPGRFDRKVFVGPPSQSDREAILRAEASRLPHPPKVAWLDWSRRTAGMSGADLSALLNEAAIEAARGNRKVITDADMSAARDRVWIGTVRSGSGLSDDERHTVAIHELGHAWVTRRMGRQLDRVSIRPRGQALGMTLSQPESERTMTRRDDVVRDLLILMGGRAAEQTLLGHITGGSADDIERASILARAAVQQLGGTAWGAYVPDAKQARTALNKTARDLVNEALAQAEKDCMDNASLLALAVPMLLDREEISASDLDRIWGPPEPDNHPSLLTWDDSKEHLCLNKPLVYKRSSVAPSNAGILQNKSSPTPSDS